jgi:conserved oligomeric Golgi complex subunit 2
MSSRFYLASPASTSNSSLSSTDPDTLPFPKPLDRSSFITPDFDPAAFLATLTNRFQTLEDLRSELATLSQTIEGELVDLVNDNYADFLNLGSSLHGGEDKIEEVRVGLLGFERDVKGLREKVEAERSKAVVLLQEKKEVMREINAGRALLEIHQRVEDLELDLGLKEKAVAPVEVKAETDDGDDDAPDGEQEWDSVWDDEPVEEDDADVSGEAELPLQLARRVERFLMLKVLVERLGKDHPFNLAEQNRIRKVRETMLLDMDAAIRAQPNVSGKQSIMRLRSDVED